MILTKEKLYKDYKYKTKTLKIPWLKVKMFMTLTIFTDEDSISANNSFMEVSTFCISAVAPYEGLAESRM